MPTVLKWREAVMKHVFAHVRCPSCNTENLSTIHNGSEIHEQCIKCRGWIKGTLAGRGSDAPVSTPKPYDPTAPGGEADTRGT